MMLSPFVPEWKTWISAEYWRQRVITFDPSWFTVCLGTGIIIQLLTNFPYPAEWLRTLGYCFWILDIFIFSFFMLMSLLRLMCYRKVAMTIFDDFNQTSFLGAVPVAFDTIIFGVLIFYSQADTAVWVAYGLYWISVTFTLAVGFGGVFAMYYRQKAHQLDEVTGVWLLSFIPMIVTSATGSAFVSHLEPRNGIIVLVVSFLMWSLGLGMCYIMLGIYFWRLMSNQLPTRDAIISTFVPVGPLGMGAYSIQVLASDLARHVISSGFVLRGPPPSSAPIDITVLPAVSEMIHWLGLLVATALLGLATFFLVEALITVAFKFPRCLNVAVWSFVFPCGVYANAFCRLSSDLRNDGLKVWAAGCVLATILLWLGCALGTFYKGVWRGKLFFAPGLQGWVEQEALDHARKMRWVEEGEKKDGDRDGDGKRGWWRRRSSSSPLEDEDRVVVEKEEEVAPTTRRSRIDGTYQVGKKRIAAATDDDSMV